MSHIWMSHVTRRDKLACSIEPRLLNLHCNTARMNESCYTNERVMSHIWMGHVTHMNESCHMYEWVISEIWMSHVTYSNESCHTHEWVTWLKKWVMSHMDDFCQPHEWVLSQIWICHITHTIEPCHTYEWAMSYIWMRHATHMSESCPTGRMLIRVTWLIHTCDMTHSYECLFICVTWLVHMCDMTHFYEWCYRAIHAWHDSLLCIVLYSVSDVLSHEPKSHVMCFTNPRVMSRVSSLMSVGVECAGVLRVSQPPQAKKEGLSLRLGESQFWIEFVHSVRALSWSRVRFTWRHCTPRHIDVLVAHVHKWHTYISGTCTCIYYSWAYYTWQIYIWTTLVAWGRRFGTTIQITGPLFMKENWILSGTSYVGQNWPT